MIKNLSTLVHTIFMFKGPFSFSGNKSRIYKLYLQNTISKFSRVHEPFVGSGVCLYNSRGGGLGIDIDQNVVGLHNALAIEDFPKMVLDKYNQFFRDPDGRKDSYYKLRQDFNKSWKQEGLSQNNLDSLYILVQHSFNSLLRFGPNGFNVPWGDKKFDIQRIKEAQKIFLEKGIEVKHGDFRELDLDRIDRERDLIYIDPPYIASKYQYGGWTEKNDIEMFEWISLLDELDYKFILSNTLRHRGVENGLLHHFSEEYHTKVVKMTYNAWAARVKGVEKEWGTIEVLVSNFEI